MSWLLALTLLVELIWFFVDVVPQTSGPHRTFHLVRASLNHRVQLVRICRDILVVVEAVVCGQSKLVILHKFDTFCCLESLLFLDLGVDVV